MVCEFQFHNVDKIYNNKSNISLILEFLNHDNETIKDLQNKEVVFQLHWIEILLSIWIFSYFCEEVAQVINILILPFFQGFAFIS